MFANEGIKRATLPDRTHVGTIGVHVLKSLTDSAEKCVGLNLCLT